MYRLLVANAPVYIQLPNNPLSIVNLPLIHVFVLLYFIALFEATFRGKVMLFANCAQ